MIELLMKLFEWLTRWKHAHSDNGKGVGTASGGHE